MSCPNCQCAGCLQVKGININPQVDYKSMLNAYQQIETMSKIQGGIQGAQGVGVFNPIKSITHQEWNQMMADLQELKEAIKKLKGE